MIARHKGATSSAALGVPRSSRAKASFGAPRTTTSCQPNQISIRGRPCIPRCDPAAPHRHHDISPIKSPSADAHHPYTAAGEHDDTTPAQSLHPARAHHPDASAANTTTSRQPSQASNAGATRPDNATGDHDDVISAQSSLHARAPMHPAHAFRRLRTTPRCQPNPSAAAFGGISLVA